MTDIYSQSLQYQYPAGVDPNDPSTWYSYNYDGTRTPLVNFDNMGMLDNQSYLKNINNLLPDKQGFTTYVIPAANTGIDNKYQLINFAQQYGQNADGSPASDATFGSMVYVPTSAMTSAPKAIDYNPSVDSDYGPLLGSLFLGGVGLASGGFGLGDLFSGASGTSGAGTAATGASSLADLYGAATGTSVVAAPAAATGSALYGAATGAAGLTGLGANMGIEDLFFDDWGVGSNLSAGSTLADMGGSAWDLVSKYGTDAAKALNMTKADGSIDWAKVAGAGANAVGGYLSGNAAQDAAKTQADAQIRAAQIAADANRLQLPNVTGNMFGTNASTYDASGRLTGVSSTAAPWLASQQQALQGFSPAQLQQYQDAMAATAPMISAGQNAMTLGNQYLSTDPQAQAMKYMQDQQALLATGRERDVNNMLTGEFNRGTYGLATGGTSTGMSAANPRLEAMYNAQRQQDLGLAAQATQGGMDYATFGAGMVGTGGDLMSSAYGVQNSAFTPYGTTMTALGNQQNLQNQALNQSLQFGSPATAAAAAGGLAQAQGITNAANTMAQADAYSPWGSLLSGVGNQVANYNNPQQQYQFDPFTGRAL